MDERITVFASMLVYIGILTAMVLCGAAFVSVANAFKDARHYKQECGMLHDKLNRVCRERDLAEADLMDELSSLRRKMVSGNWAYDSRIEKLQSQVKAQRKMISTLSAQLGIKEKNDD